MNVPAAPINLAAIENFVGYGTAAAPVVFVGIEEKLSDSEGRIAGLAVRSHFQQVMDVQEAHAAGLPHHPRLFNQQNPWSQPTWRSMCHLLLRHGHVEMPVNLQERRDAILQYQTTHLGRHDGTSLLAELLPLPHGSTTDWWYNDFYPAIHTRADYEAHMLPQRTTLLAQQLALHPRNLIICYGRGYFASFRAFIARYRDELDLPQGPIEWELIPLANLQTGRQWIAKRTIIGETSIVLANHLTRMPLSSYWGMTALAQLLGIA